jgi:hypothetical protein
LFEELDLKLYIPSSILCVEPVLSHFLKTKTGGFSYPGGLCPAPVSNYEATLILYVRQVEFSYHVVNFQQQEVKPGSQQQQQQHRVKKLIISGAVKWGVVIRLFSSV